MNKNKQRVGRKSAKHAKFSPNIFLQPQTEKISARNKKDIDLILTLIDGIQESSIPAYKLANETLKKLIIDSPLKKEFNPLDNLLFGLGIKLSNSHLPGFATLDSELINQINLLSAQITSYVKDPSQQRPLNFLMLASPGAGKSHFISCLASKLSGLNIRAINFNMASMQSYEDLAPSLDAARNLKVNDQLPLLFLDEFDSSDNNYALLLPLLWDGGINIAQRDLRLGKIIVVMAGSNPTLPATMDYARSMRSETQIGQGSNPKLIDLFSRVNGGVLKIAPFYDPAHNIDRRIDKVCILIQLLKKRFGNELERIPIGLLRFIANVDFRYDVRSLAHLVDLIPYKKNAKEITMEGLSLPLKTAALLKKNSLAYHLLHEDQSHGIVKNWQEIYQVKTLISLDISIANMVQTFPREWRKQYINSWLESIKNSVQ